MKKVFQVRLSFRTIATEVNHVTFIGIYQHLWRFWLVFLFVGYIVCVWCSKFDILKNLEFFG